MEDECLWKHVILGDSTIEDLQQVDGIAWDDALTSVGLINLLDEPMTEEPTVEGSQYQQSLASGSCKQVTMDGVMILGRRGWSTY